MTPSHAPKGPPLHEPLGVPSAILESEPPTDNTKPSQDTFTASSASQNVPPSPLIPPSPKPQPYEADATPPRDDSPSVQVKEELAVDVGPHPGVAAKPAQVRNGNLNLPSSVRAAEPSSSADRPSAGDDDNGPLQEDGTIKGQMDVHITNENPVVVAVEAKQKGHAECDDIPQLGSTAAESAEKAPVDMAPAPVLDGMTAPTNEGVVNPATYSMGRLRLNEPGKVGTEKEVQEDATAAQGDRFVFEGVQAHDHNTAKNGHSDENSAISQVPADTAPTLEPEGTFDHSEICATPPTQPEPTEKLEGSLNTPIVDRVKEESVKDPSQSTISEQEPTALSPSVKTSEGATSQWADPVVEATERSPFPDAADATVDKESDPVVPPHDAVEVKEQPEGDAIVADKTKEGALSVAVDVENLTPYGAQGPDSAVKETGSVLPIQQEEGMTSTASGTEAPIDVQYPTSVEPADAIPAELAFAAPDSQSNIEDPVEPSLPPADGLEAPNYSQASHLEATEATSSTQENPATVQLPASTEPEPTEDSTSALPPEEPVIGVQAKPDEYKSEEIPEEGAKKFSQPVLNADPAQEEGKQEEAAESTEAGAYRPSVL